MLKIMVMYMFKVPGKGQTTPWGKIVFINIIIQLIESFSASFPPLNDFEIVSPFKRTGDPI